MSEARLGRCGLVGIDAAPVNVGQQPRASGHAAQFVVQALLDAGVALLLEIHGAQNVRGQRALRIVPLAFVTDRDPLQPQG